MRYKVDHDFHIHSQLSDCSSDPLQTNERILEYAKSNGLKEIYLTNHIWDKNVACDYLDPFYYEQDSDHILKALPLPKDENVKFTLGCETELDKNCVLGLSRENFDRFGFVIIPTTHLQMHGFTISNSRLSLESRAQLWGERLEKLLSMDLPFHKIGIAHPACRLMAKSSREDYLKVLDMIPDKAIYSVFEKASKLGVGVELNGEDMKFSPNEADVVLRMFKIAKKCGCKFYLGSDAHHPEALDRARATFERAIDLLELDENDKFHIKN